MPKHLIASPHLSVAELEQRYRHERDPVARSHWQIVWLRARGQPPAAIAEMTGYCIDWVRTIIHRYNDGGPAALGDRRHDNPGAAPLLDAAGQVALRQALAGPAPDGGLWTGPKVARWMTIRLDQRVSPQVGWTYLRKLGFTPQRPRPHHTQADPDAQDAFKKRGLPPKSKR
jgi:transposase